MSERCAVETFANFGFWATPQTSDITSDSGAYAFIHSGSEEVLVFDLKEKKLTDILQFPASVSDVVQSEDQQHLFVASGSAVYCIHLPPLQSRCPTTPSSSPVELKLTLEDAVLREEGVLSLLAVGTALVTLSRREASWVFSVNKPGEGSGLYETLSSCSLPTFSDVTEQKKPVMTYVCLNDSSFLSNKHLEPALFKLLFGVDSALARSPVILCGLPDGRLCSLSLRLVGIRVLHSLEEPVVFVGASVVMETDAGGPYARCLVAAGEHGRVVVIKTRRGATEEEVMQVGFTEGCVPGPVMSACADGTSLYLSTGSDLLSLRLTEESHGLSEEEHAQRSNSLQSPISLNVCRIIALAKPASNAAGAVELLTLSDKGQMRQVTVPKSRADEESSTALKTQTGRSVKDLLSAIGDVCERAAGLKTSIKSKNQTLWQLNQVMNVSFFLLNTTDNAEQLIRCHAATRWTTLLQRDSLHLTCVLENNSPYSLEEGWRLNLTVCPLSCSQEDNTSTTYSFPFCDLGPGQKLDVTLPLTAADNALLPVTVSCVLVFSLTTLLDEKLLASALRTPHSLISLPLNSLTVDWLHVLQLSTSVNDQNMASRPRAMTASVLHGFLKSKGRDKVVKEQRKTYSASVKLSSELLRDTLQTNCEAKHPPNLCIALLDWLLSEHHRGVAGHPRQNSTHNALLHTEGPNGRLIKLVVKEVNVGVEEESLSVVDVQVESSSLAAVCGLHHAILDRVQGLVKSAPQKSPSVREESLGLRPTFLRTERLLQQIRESRVSGAFGVGASSGLMTRSHLEVYQELRQHPLVIL